jgi:hypothetical protein
VDGAADAGPAPGEASGTFPPPLKEASMTKLRPTLTRLALCLLAALALGSAVQSAAASAAPFPIPASLYTYRVPESFGSLDYKVNVPCQKNKRVVGRFYHWNVCDYTITAQSGTAFFAMPNSGGDAYSYMKQVSDDSISSTTPATFPIRIVDDSTPESDETIRVKLVLTVRDCSGAVSNNARYPACWQEIGTYTRYGTVTILDND